MNIGRVSLLSCLTIIFLVCLLGLSYAIIESTRSIIRGKQIDEVFLKELGITHKDKDVILFMNRELGGLTYSEAIAKLEQWGNVVSKDCPESKPTRSCLISVENLLGTIASYRFTVFFQENKITSVTIRYS